MAVNLDNLTLYQTLDPDGMLQTIRDLPQQVQDAWEIAHQALLPESHKAAQRIVVTGMGGSAIGADLVGGLLARKGQLPLEVIRGYDLPPYITGEDTLVVMSSYSGNTEETLSTFTQAQTRGTLMLAITTGGRLAAQAGDLKMPVWRFAYKSTPRAAVGYSMTLLLGLCTRLGALSDVKPAIEEAVTRLESLQPTLTPESPTDQNPAKQMALKLVGRIPAIFGSGFLAPVARRWKCQVNENSKQWAIWDELPELNHNSVEGFDLPSASKTTLSAIFLRSELDHPRIQIRWDVTQALLEEAEIPVHQVKGQGNSAISQLLTLIHFGDFVSYYLAALNGVDPASMPNIITLKERMAEAS